MEFVIDAAVVISIIVLAVRALRIVKADRDTSGPQKAAAAAAAVVGITASVVCAAILL